MKVIPINLDWKRVNYFLYSTLTGDESWIYHYYLGIKSHKYHHPNSLRKKKQWEALSAAGKGTLRRLGIQRHHSPGYIVKCTKINSKINAKALQKLKQRINRIRWGRAVKSILLQHEDGRPHPSAINSAAIRSVGIDVIPHLPFQTRCDTVWLPVCISQEASQRIYSDHVSYL